MKKYVPIALVVLLLVVAIPILSQLRAQGLSVGQKAPDFTLSDPEGNTVALKDLSGQVVMLNFWSAACPPCREEMPHMQAVYDELKEQGFTILAVNVNDHPVLAGNFMQENGYTFPWVKDDLTVSRLYEVQFIPKTVMIDGRGIMRQIIVGPVSKDQLREMVMKLL